MKQAVRIALTLAAALTLAGCVGIPDSGPVTEGQVVDAEGPVDLEFLAEAPQPDATAEQIIQGFIFAAVSPSGNYAIARQYLTDSEAAAWDPYAGVTIRSGQPEVTSTGEFTSDVAVDVVGTVDSNGVYSTQEVTTSIDQFTLARVNGQWRISDAPDGVVLSAFHFGELFTEHRLAWYTPDFGRIVPEVRWFERSQSSIRERIVDALLAGPSQWLAGAVTTAASPGAERVGAVAQGSASTALVTVSVDQVAQSSPVELARLALQLSQSLSRVGIGAVTVSVAGVDGYTASTNEAPPVIGDSVDPRPLLLEGDTLRFVGGGGGTLRDVGPTLVQLGAISYSTNADNSAGVVLGDDGIVWLAGSDVTAISPDITSEPTLDPYGWVWWTPGEASGTVNAWRDGRELRLVLPVGGDRVDALSISRDGTRLAALTRGGGISKLWIFGVARENEAPRILSASPAMPALGGIGNGVTWIDDDSVAVLASADDGPVIQEFTIGGSTTELARPPATVVQIVGGSEGATSLRVLLSDGRVLALRAAGWSATTGLGDVSLIATQL